ncbi:MAG TPA: CBS domain-containing protein [Nitrosarchaeum sp.]
MYPVEEIMKVPVTLGKDAVISEAIRIMANKKIGRILVSDNQKITSIATEKDMVFFLLNDQSEKKLEEIPIHKIMKPVLSVSESTSIKSCAKKMLENGIGSLAVTQEGKITGIITKTDLIEYFAKTQSGKKIVGEYMSPYYAWAYADSPLYSIVSKMINDKISRLILRNNDETPIGILSFSDLFRLSLTIGNQNEVVDDTNPSIPVVFPRKGFVSKDGFGGTIKASQIMKDEIITVNYDDDLAKASQVLIDKKINGVGVLSSNGTLIGILSKTDIIKAIAFLN